MSELRVIAVCCGWLLCGLYFGSLVGESRARAVRDEPTPMIVTQAGWSYDCHTLPHGLTDTSRD